MSESSGGIIPVQEQPALYSLLQSSGGFCLLLVSCHLKTLTNHARSVAPGILEPGGLTGKAEVGVRGTGFCWSLWARTLLSSRLFRPRAHPISFLAPSTFLTSPTSPAMTLHTVPTSLYSHYQDRPDPSLAQDPSLDPHGELPNRVQ